MAIGRITVVSLGYLTLLLLQVRVEGTWTGPTYWNSRYGTLGINYATTDAFEGLWSDSPGIIDHYFLSTGSDSGRQCSGGCNCDETKRIVTGCSGPTVVIKGYAFDNLTVNSFSSSVTKITIINAPNFKYFDNATFDHLTNLEELSLMKNDIEWVPDNLFSGSRLEYVGLSINNIRYFPGKAFENANNIQFVNLSNNLISYIQPGAFSQLQKLLILELHDNDLSTLAEGVFGNIPNILHLDLVRNNLQILKSKYFTNLPALRTLRLHSQKIKMTNIYFDAFENINENLTNLWVSDNALTSFPHQVLSEQTYLSLKEVVLSANRIAEVKSDYFCVLTNLQYLYLDQNLLTDEKFPNDALDCMAKLFYLELSSNSFKYVPQTVRSSVNMTSLTQLFLGSNHLTFLEADTFTNASLTILNLQGNDFRFTHQNPFTNLASLTRLELNNNEIDDIPDDAFDGCTSLSYLALSNNKLGWLKTTMFEDTVLRNFYASNNEIAYIEEGTFKNFTSMTILYLDNNALTKLPSGGDFSDKTITHLQLQENRITEINSGVFNNLNVAYLYLQNNEISVIGSEGFKGVQISQRLYLTGNTLKKLESRAFVDVNIAQLSLNDMQLTYLLRDSFVNVQATDIFLQNNKIAYIEEGAFDTVSIGDDLHLNGNGMTSLQGNIFANSSVISDSLYLQNNNLSSIPINAFDNLSVRRVYLQDNSISDYPTDTLSNKASLTTVDLTNNKITSVTASTFLNQVSLTDLDLDNNLLTTISKDVFTPLINLRNLDLSGNSIGYVEPLSFSSLTSLQTLDISSNQLIFFPKLPNMTSLKSVDISHNKLQSIEHQAFDDFQNSKVFKTLKLDENLALGCDCYLYETLLVVQTTISGGQCGTPASVQGVLFGYVNKTSPMQYRVTCTSSPGAVVSQATVSGTTHTFTSADGITASTTYVCTAALVTANHTSAESQPVVLTTQAITATGSNATVGATDWILPIVYYDYSVTNSDFNGFSDDIISKPTYVPSPFGSWLLRSANPNSDSFSGWFSALNSYFPVDNKGFGNQDKDCYGVEHNFGFTSAIRSGFVFQGTESVTIGGGDDLWLYLNGKFVMEISSRNMGTSVPCRKISLSAASNPGGSYITPQYGFVSPTTGLCVITSTLPTEQVLVELEVGERYHFSIFHVERLHCASSLYIQTENFQFIVDPAEEPPRDYIVTATEDLHQNGIVAEVVLADIFSVGPPFTVTILRGNEARHFTLKDKTTANENAAVAPPTVPPTYTTINGHSFVACATPSTITPEGYDGTTETFTVNTGVVLLTLDSSLDYEVKTSYSVVMETVDTGKTPPTTGTITVKVKVSDVNDNCPELTQTLYQLQAIPALQVAALAVLNASDIDSGNNSALSFYLSTIVEDPPISIFNDTMDLYKEVYEANTMLKFTVIVVDGGSPMRGATAAVELDIDNSCLIDVEYQAISYSITVNVSTGEINHRVPGYYYYEYTCDDALGMESGVILDKYISVSSSSSISGPDRARLNTTQLDANLGGLTGGWVPATMDTNQYIEVNLTEPTFVHWVQIQGQDSVDNWVTSFSVIYSSDGVTWATYTNSSGASVFEGATDRNTVVSIPMVPAVFGTYIRINPQTWNNAIGLRLEMKGCSFTKYQYYRTTCQRCLTASYCEGDSTIKPCGRCDPPVTGSTCGRSPTEHSFGAAASCTTCPEGWICKDGYATPCPEFHYVTCNDTYCPASCTQCEPGYACRGGKRYQCKKGTYSDGNTKFCTMCSPGTYQDEVGQSSCKNCPGGYYSSSSKDRCNPCEAGTYAATDGTGCKSCGSTTQCPCMGSTTLCYHPDLCYNMDGSYGCLPCPTGYAGNGVTCSDVDECTSLTPTPCFQQRCRNTEPGFQCLACPLGYVGTYEDALSFNISRRTFQLYNTGSYSCGLCKDGYVGNTVTGCELADYCLSGKHTCHANATCYYTGPQEYKCVCNNGWAGNGYLCGDDPDQDGVPTLGLPCSEEECKSDNCPLHPNSGQEDADTDGMGNACDADDDNDVIYDEQDNCPYKANNNQADADLDGVGDVCDNCPNVANADQSDVNADGVGDLCHTDNDKDGDGVLDGVDLCPLVATTAQTDSDGDGVGDECDNCPQTSNPTQTDSNYSGVGDSCDGQDKDGDGIPDFKDNCPEVPNAQQTDTDSDSTGDFCDPDIDNDGVLNAADNCVYVANADQADTNGNRVGDVCESDRDLDGVVNNLDVCPNNKDISSINFTDYTAIDLNPTLILEKAAVWHIMDKGREVRQTETTLKPAAYIGNQYFDHMEFSGTTYAQSDECYGYIGFIFGFHSTQKYYLALWRHVHLNYNIYGGIKGVQLRVIETTNNVGQNYANALYQSYDVTSYSRLLWQDPTLTGWNCRTSYRWTIQHTPSQGILRLIVKEGDSTIADSGTLYDVSIPGGRIGVFAYNQTGVIWSDMRFECKDRTNKALSLDGSTYGTIGNMTGLRIEKSFTMEAWVNLPTGFPSTAIPILCTNGSDLCLYVEGGVFKSNVSTNSVTGTTPVTADKYNHVLVRYNAQAATLSLFVNGTKEAEATDLVEISWATDVVLYLGYDGTNYLTGKLDDIRIYNVQIPDSEVSQFWQKVGMERDFQKYTLSAHYTMDDNPSSTILMDQSPHKMDVSFSGTPSFVESTSDFDRYYLTNG
uniref:Thrombospondin-4 n=1 Tax=Magallana gigas TaxID=29159 RepID=K1P9Z2_MAGGI